MDYNYTTKYTWNVLPRNNVWTYSDSFFIENLNVAFSLAIILRKDEKRCTIKLTKYPTKQGIAVVGIRICHRTIVGPIRVCQDWVEDLIFESTEENFWGKLEIVCQVLWHGFVEDISTNPCLPNHMSTVSNNDETSDITIIVDGNQKIPAHKSVLAIRSPKFLAMLSSEKTGQLKIDGVNAKIMKKILTFFYTGNLSHKNNVDLLIDMLAAAEKYELKHLKINCELELFKLVTVNNVLRIFKAANSHNANQLYHDIIDFMAVNLDTVSKMDNFKKLNTENPKIFADMVTNFSHYNSLTYTRYCSGFS